MTDDVTVKPYDDPKILGTAAWWVERLSKALMDRLPRLLLYDRYYEGEHNLTFASEKFRQRWGNLFGPLSDNWTELVVNAVEERIEVQGFRMPSDTTDSEAGSNYGVKADQDAWTIWQRNNLDAFSRIAHEEAFVAGESYLLIWPDKDGKAKVNVESAQQMICETDPESPTLVRAALKRWQDDTGYIFATLYMPDYLFKFQSDKKVYTLRGSTVLAQSAKWVPRIVDGEEWPLPNRLGEVPVVPLQNKPRLLKPGVSEIKQVIPIQNVVNKFMADMILASEYQSFRQRAIMGIDIPRDPETNEPMTDVLYKQMLEKIWMFEGDNAKVWESTPLDLTSFVRAIELAVQHIASRTRTPPHYFYLSGTFPSGESLKSAETGLVKKALRRMVTFGESWETAMRLCFKVEDDPRGQVTDSEVIWKNPESRTEGVTADAGVKWQEVGVPQEFIWEYLGFSPQQIERAKALNAANPPVTAPVVPQGELIDVPATAAH